MEFDLSQLRALSVTVSEGTFEAAARRLHVTPSAVSQRIKALESAVGSVLLQRTKPVEVTESGQAVLRLARQIEILTADTHRELGDELDDGRPASVPIAVNADSLATWILPALAALPPGTVFDLHLDDQDHTTALLRSGAVMAAVTAVARPIQGCTSSRLGTMRYRARCSAEFAARWFPEGATPAALAVAPVVVFDTKDDLQDAFLRRAGRRRADPPRQFVPSSADFVRAVELGLGWGMIPDLQASDRLVELDPAGDATDVALYWQQWQLRSATLDRVAEAVREAATATLR
ncbi:LysR family transcriptional regulator (chromosome initiation inhibitor) [Conyzicola lurida]|uniref:LysR family transcriptional regulator (Chromosome initiation inhibitor) n=1 Tax=Conyzicola lurida TaxID=1172621 RepID=A0A841AEU9_9MICO|nr:LysR family transcriptional regulator ArgP [Conyzicola lurida]MBB5841767.1 LysR family transcriptional regulator (chromosome initiation inhibitor) [Conyzicola lurida]